MLCSLSETKIENAFHMFATCQVNEGCWEKLNHKQRVDDFVLEVDSPIFKLLQGLRDQQRRRVAMLLWSIWRRRNEKLWNNQAELDVAAIQRGDDTTTKVTF